MRRAQAFAVTWMVLTLPTAGMLAGCSSTPASPTATACAVDLEDRISTSRHEDQEKAATDLRAIAAQLQHAADQTKDPAAKTAFSALAQDLTTYASSYLVLPPSMKWADKFMADRRAVEKACGR